MDRHVQVIDPSGKVLSTYLIQPDTEDVEMREAAYIEAARRRAREENLVEDEAQAQALRFEFATGPR